jgi:hypothetical protein
MNLLGKMKGLIKYCLSTERKEMWVWRVVLFLLITGFSLIILLVSNAIKMSLWGCV